jgi:peptidoglycan lytic transglycosylase
MEVPFRFIAVTCLVFPLYACTTSARTESQEQEILDTQFGDATFYARHFQGDRTANGSRFDHRKAVAAHRKYPFGTVVRVTNLRNGRSVNVVIVDRGPYGKNRGEGAIIDLSHDAARTLGMIRDGQVPVKVEVLLWGDER